MGPHQYKDRGDHLSHMNTCRTSLILLFILTLATFLAAINKMSIFYISTDNGEYSGEKENNYFMMDIIAAESLPSNGQPCLLVTMSRIYCLIFMTNFSIFFYIKKSNMVHGRREEETGLHNE